MGGFCCCPRTDEFDHPHCSFLPFFFHHLLSRCGAVFHRVESRPAFPSPGGNSLAWSDACENESSALSLSTSPTFDADHRYSRDGLVSRKSMPHFQQDSHPASLTNLKWNGVDNKLGYGLTFVEPSSEDEDVCPTCLEEYTTENPKITTRCSHHFHLGCIYEWLERSESCPVCGKEMEFCESP